MRHLIASPCGRSDSPLDTLARRVKCDEARPVCEKCQCICCYFRRAFCVCRWLFTSYFLRANTHIGRSGGKPCYYHTDNARSADSRHLEGHGFRNILPKSSRSVLLSPAPDESPYALSSENESRYLQFFIEKTIPQFLILFPASAWRTRVLQTAHVEPSIRHALISLASSHEWHLDAENRKRPNAESDLSSRHYSLALSCLQKKLTRQQQRHSIYINLCSCLLFLCIEVRAKTPFLRFY